MGIFQINTNVSSLDVQRNLNTTSLNLTNSLQKLSSGLRINTGADDPAGLVISDLMASNINANNMAIQNTQDAMGLFSTADGALGQVSNLLSDLKARVVHATNSGLVSAAQIAADQAEFNDALTAINNIFSNTTYASKSLFVNYSAKAFQTGAGATDQMGGVNATKPAGVTGLSGKSVNKTATLALVDTAISSVATLRGTIGSFMKGQLQSNINTLSVNVENLSASESNIRDTNMAEEVSNYTKQQILVQAGMSVLAQANVSSQSVLQLLR